MHQPIQLLDLIDKEKLNRLLEVFTGVTGVASIIAHPDGTPTTEPHNFTRFCSNFCRSTPMGRSLCHKSDRHGGIVSARTRKPHIYNCLNAGLIDCAAPIIVEQYHLGTILCGQVLEKPMLAEVAAQRALRIGITDVDSYLAELENVPIMSRKLLLAIVKLMSEITQTISELALQKYLSHKDSQRYLTRLIDSVSDCIISTNEYSTISMVNEAGARMFGQETSELLNRPILDLFADSVSKKTYVDNVDVAPSNNWRAEMTARKAGGQTFPVQVSMSKVCTVDKENSGYVGVIRDISEEKRIDRMKDDLIGMLTHDMRNPVLSIQKAVQLLVNGPLGALNERQLEVLRLVLATSHQLYGMASDLLDIYREENGQFLLHRSVIDLADVIKESINHLKMMARDKKISIRFGPYEEPIHVWGDPNRLLRTLGNLLDNAIKHSPDRGTITIDVHRLNGNPQRPVNCKVPDQLADRLPSDAPYWVTSVSDEGIGIPEQYHSCIFDKFFSIKSKDHNGRKGVGLGLSFCKQVIEAHDGFIWLDSPISKDKYGKPGGCRFSFGVPSQPIRQ
ncbi:MAG: PocR ligand-binding domain-containing protein [Deltaproteobacteria bacterium]|nr:PocR ligand-binding domain-containing protein [Deltaproteobacteria bacterium]